MKYRTAPTSRRSRILLATLLPIALVRGGGAMDNPSPSIFYLASHGDLAAVKARVERNPELVHETKAGESTALHSAADGGQAHVIDYLVSRGANLEARDSRGQAPLHRAAYNDEPGAVQLLLDYGADANARDSFNSTPLHHAVTVPRFPPDDHLVPPAEQARRLEAVKLLVAAGSDIETRDNLGRTPLHVAVESNLPQAIQHLVEQGAEIEARDNSGHTPLLSAARTSPESFEALETLVQFGADPAARIKSSPSDNEFWNGLSLAARRGHLKTVRFLLELDVPPQYRSGRTKHSALWGALQNASSAVGLGGSYEKRRIAEHLAVIDLLAQEIGGINKGILGNYHSALDVANEPFLVRHLLKKYPDDFANGHINAAITKASAGLDADSRRDREESQKTLQFLQAALDGRRGGDANPPAKGGGATNEASHDICELASIGDLAAIKARVERNPALIHETKFGNTLLHYAARDGRVDVIDYLIEKGIDVNADGVLGRTPLHDAASNAEVAAMKSLLDHGAKIDARDRLGYTPLHQAVNTPRSDAEPMPPGEQKQRLNAATLLIDSGAKVDVRSDRERTPLHLAAESNLPQVVEYLIEQGAEIDAVGSDGLTALHWAGGASRSVEAFKTLVELGADPTIRMQGPSRPQDDGIDRTYNALSWVAVWGNLEMVKLLLEKDMPTRYGSGESEHSVLYDALHGASWAPFEGADEEQFARHLAVVDLLAQETGDINAGVKHGSFKGTALEVAGAPYVARHLLTDYSEEFTMEDIKAAIDKFVKEGDSGPGGVRDAREETVDALNSALLIFGILEARKEHHHE